jgi:hypothetical protein
MSYFRTTAIITLPRSKWTTDLRVFWQLGNQLPPTSPCKWNTAVLVTFGSDFTIFEEFGEFFESTLELKSVYADTFIILLDFWFYFCAIEQSSALPHVGSWRGY